MKFILEITIVFAMVVMAQGFMQKVNPCATVRCAADTKCVVKYGRAFCQPDFCSLPAETGLCKAYIPSYFYNTKTGKCEIFIYGGCGGNNNNFDTKKKCEAKCGGSVTPCLPPLIIQHCKAAPCDVSTCPAYPKATCVNNYSCGGCFADYYLYGRKVNCRKVLPTLPAPLPSSCAAVTCFKDQKCVVIDGKATCKPVCKSSSDCKQQGSFCNKDSGVCRCGRFCPLVHFPVCGSDGKQYGNLCLLNASACDKGITITTVPC